MNSKRIRRCGKFNCETGAALPMVLLIAFLLLTASVALLSGVAAGTRNGTDMLSETKAYYAAESGLQATINALRHRNPKVKYSEADSNPSMDSYITYNYQAGTSGQRVVIGQPAGSYDPLSGEAYSLAVDDPDNYAAGLSFNSNNAQTRFTSYTGTGGGVITTSSGVSTVTITDSAASTQTTITMTPKPNTPVVFSDGDTSNDVQSLVDFGFTTTGATMPVGDEIRFQIIYTLVAPRTDAPKKTIYGKVISVAGAPMVTLDSPTAELVGSSITLCSTNVANCTFSSPMALNQAVTPLYVRMTPAEPIRLRVRSTGYGPNGAKKELEAIIRKDIPNLSASPAATSMIGPNACPVAYPSCLGFSFLPGTSDGITYSGCPTDGSGCVPSFGLTDPTNHNLVTNAERPNGDPISASPPPEMISGSLPDWQQSVAALQSFVDDVRVQAQGSDRYFRSSDGTTPVVLPNNPGDFNTGTGVTFCEGSCTVGGSGGGILVVTGQLTNTGNFSFKGLIVVVGEEGWLRNGGGNGQIIGSVVIAPYNMRSYIPANYASTFLPPRYLITGGGNSDVIYGDVSGAFGTTSGVSDLVQAIAER